MFKSNVNSNATMTTIKRSDFRFLHRLRGRLSDLGQSRSSVNALGWLAFDSAMADYWRALALPYDVSLQALGGELQLKKATVEFHAPVHADELLDVALRCSHIGQTSIHFTAAIFKGEQALLSAERLEVFTDPASQTEQAVPAELRAILDAYEAMEPMVRVELGVWQTLAPQARLIRTEVFLQEQHIPVEMEWDELDASAVHALAHNRLGLAVGTGRLLQHAPGVGRIGRMAVNRLLRGTHIGRALLQALMQAAAERGDHQVLLHAQRSAEGFYARLGFTPQGEPFEEAGIAHIEMVRSVSALRRPSGL